MKHLTVVSYIPLVIFIDDVSDAQKTVMGMMIVDRGRTRRQTVVSYVPLVIFIDSVSDV